MDYISSVGCIQYDPVDICGKNSAIVLQARVKDFTENVLDKLLYEKRELIDFFDKNLCIFPTKDWPYLAPYFIKHHQEYTYHPQSEIEELKPLIRRLLKQHDSLSARDLRIDQRTIWHWSVPTSLARAALETMYFDGELIIHHKTGTIKSYALAKDHLPSQLLKAKPPFRNEEQRFSWLAERRIGAIGMLWDKASDVWLGIKISAAQRSQAFQDLLARQLIFAVRVEDVEETFYVKESARPLLAEVCAGKRLAERTELLAPLDCLLWDRKLIKAIFDFSYKWEIYTPPAKREYGPYSLPLLQGERFIGRIDLERGERQLLVLQFYPEANVVLRDKHKQAVNRCLRAFAKFNKRQEVGGLF